MTRSAPGALRILGIDPGSRVCGYGMVVWAGDRFAYVECGVVTASEADPMEQRLGEIARGLTEVVAELRPSCLAVEDVFARINIKSAIALAQARGVALAVAGMAGVPVHSYTAPMVKKTVVGRGRAEKDQVARMVAGLLGLRTAPRSDAADALAIALTHGQHWQASGVALVPAVVPAGAGLGGGGGRR